MPGPALHFLLASQLPGKYEPDEKWALFAGSVAPDMGYFPGGDRLISDLAHYVASGRLARAMVRVARPGVAAAFARGWASHVVADSLFHPLINRAAHELVFGTTSGVLTYADHPESHIRVEQGLDAVIGQRFPQVALTGTCPATVFRNAVQVLSPALREIYRSAPPARLLTGSFRSMIRGLPFLALYRQAAAASFSSGAFPPLAARAAFALARLATPAGGVLHAFARPQSPSTWLLDEVVRAVSDFPARFEALEKTGFATVPDCNLDTGEPEEAPYGPSQATRVRLAAILERRDATDERRNLSTQ